MELTAQLKITLINDNGTYKMISWEPRILLNARSAIEVEITQIINGANFDEHYLSCGHIQNVSKLTEQDYNLSQTCTICGLTARNKKELDEHVGNAHSL